MSFFLGLAINKFSFHTIVSEKKTKRIISLYIHTKKNVCVTPGAQQCVYNQYSVIQNVYLICIRINLRRQSAFL